MKKLLLFLALYIGCTISLSAMQAPAVQVQNNEVAAAPLNHVVAIITVVFQAAGERVAPAAQFVWERYVAILNTIFPDAPPAQDEVLDGNTIHCIVS